MDVGALFDSVPWDEKAPGLRQKVTFLEGKQVRLAEFSPEFEEPGWCAKGHRGVVLEGELHLEISGGVRVYRTGEELAIPDGELTKHRHVTGSPRALLYLYDET